jgi:protein-tyrosine phosphatase
MNSNDEKFIDIHCHCLPDIDDGPGTLGESISLCRKLNDNGIKKVIATPHQLGRYGEFNDGDRIRKKVSELNKELEKNRIRINVLPGADVRVDERICQFIEDDKVLTLADNGRHVLLELPHEIFIDIKPLIVELSSLGIQAIISHPERHPVIARKPEVLYEWLEESAHLQITAASLLGDFGSIAKKTAWKFLDMGMVSIVATDSHDLSRRKPRMKDAFNSIIAKLGEEIARLVCKENPLRILEGKDVLTARSVGIRRLISERVPSRF